LIDNSDIKTSHEIHNIVPIKQLFNLSSGIIIKEQRNKSKWISTTDNAGKTQPEDSPTLVIRDKP